MKDSPSNPFLQPPFVHPTNPDRFERLPTPEDLSRINSPLFLAELIKNLTRPGAEFSFWASANFHAFITSAAVLLAMHTLPTMEPQS